MHGRAATAGQAVAGAEQLPLPSQALQPVLPPRPPPGTHLGQPLQRSCNVDRVQLWQVVHHNGKDLLHAWSPGMHR